jgi:hypothetical protein
MQTLSLDKAEAQTLQAKYVFEYTASANDQEEQIFLLLLGKKYTINWPEKWKTAFTNAGNLCANRGQLKLRGFTGNLGPPNPYFDILIANIERYGLNDARVL